MISAQCKAVIEYMEKAKANGITTQDARRIGICSLSRRICDITERGYVIRKEWVKVKSRWGKTQIRRYILVSKPKQRK